MATGVQSQLKLPYAWFGGKTRAVPLIWQALGDCRNYVEPFFGGGAALLLRPDYEPLKHTETINDLDSNLANFWRSLQADPDSVLLHCDYPVSEVDLHARHRWITNRTWSANSDFSERMCGDPGFYDAKQAGWWVWGVSASIGTFLDGPGREKLSIPALSSSQGIHRKVSHFNGPCKQTGDLQEYIQALAERVRRVRICCGSFERVLTPAVTTRIGGVTGVLLDPPYASHEKVYAESSSVSRRTREWAIAHGGNQSKGKNTNSQRERLWMSPHCLPVEGEVGVG